MERLNVEIKPSACLCLLCLGIHLLALIALWMAGLSWLMSFGIGLALVASAAWRIRRYGLLADPSAIVALDCMDGNWRLKRNDGCWVKARMDNTVVLTRFLVLMNFRDDDGNRYPVALLQDSTSREDFRETRRHLRLHAW